MIIQDPITVWAMNKVKSMYNKIMIHIIPRIKQNRILNKKLKINKKYKIIVHPNLNNKPKIPQSN